MACQILGRSALGTCTSTGGVNAMTSQPKAALVAACLVSAFLCSTILAQTAETTKSPRELLEDMRKAPSYERPEVRQALVAADGEAASLLVAELEKGDQTADANFIANCIIALGDLKAQQATDALLAALESPNMQIAYLAAKALGNIWEGQGSADPTVKRVNAALLALLYSDIPPVGVYGPGLALVRINNIAVRRPENLTPEELVSNIETWANGNSDALPPVDQQPWQLNLHTVLTTRDAAVRQAAFQALRQKRALEAIEPALEALAGNADADVRNALGSLLTELTGVPFPPQGQSASDPAEEVAQWRELWLNELKQRTEQRFIDLAWSELDKKLRLYYDSPSDEAAKAVRDYRNVLIFQLSGPE